MPIALLRNIIDCNSQFNEDEQISELMATLASSLSQHLGLYDYMSQFTGENHDLVAAILSGQLESVKTLLHEDAGIDTQLIHGMSPLHVASLCGFTDIVEVLLDNGADIDTRDNDGLAPLLKSIYSMRFDTARLLIKRKAPVSTRDHE